MKKIIAYSLLLIGVISLNIGIINPKPAQANKELNCDGYVWVHCSSGEYVIRCTCDGGPTCWASWQDLCN